MQQGDLAMALTELAAEVGERNRADPLLCHSDKGLGLEKTVLACEAVQEITTWYPVKYCTHHHDNSMTYMPGRLQPGQNITS